MFEFLPNYDMTRDFIYIIQVIASFIVFYLSYQLSRQIKDVGVASATTGLTLILIGFGIFHLNYVLRHYYPVLDTIFYDRISDVIFLSLMTLSVVFSEIDYVKHSQDQKMVRIKYPLSLISIIGTSILGTLCVIDLIPNPIPFFFIIIPVLITAKRHFNQFITLENVKRKKAVPWFAFGISLTGFSNFFPALAPIFGEWIFTLYSSCVIIGGIIMLKVWQWIPPLSDLNWLLKLEKLLVVDQKRSLVLFENKFQTSQSLRSESEHNGLAGPVISGISILLEEVLATKEKIHIIDHGDKKLYFSHGNLVTCILFANGISEEFEYRLNLFLLQFEKNFKDIIENWNGDITHFKSAINLIEDIFTH